MARRHLFTSESVSMGHPDKLADQISDSVLDACLEQDANSRVACETLVTTGLCLVAGEITSNANVDYTRVARETIRKVGYVDDEWGLSADSCAVMIAIGKQSADIARGVDESSSKEQGAGDQGLMFGYACNETKELMPMPIMLAHRMVEKLAQLRFDKELWWIRPDSKSQVTVEYEDGVPRRLDTVVISTQHDPKVKMSEV